MKKNYEKTEQTKQNLLTAFLLLYSKKEIEHITIKDITDRAGYNRGTFYVYFKDVYDILEYAETDLLNQLSKILDSITSETDIWSTDLCLQIFKSIYQKNGKIVYTLITKPNSNFIKRYKKLLKKKFHTNKQQISDDKQMSFDYAIEYQISAVIGIIQHWVDQGFNASADEMFHLSHIASQRGVWNILK